MSNPSLAVVTEIVGTNRVKIRIEGDERALQGAVRYLASYVPTVGDRVYFVRDSGSYIVLGRLK